MTVAGEDPGAADAEDVDEAAVRDGGELRVEPGPGNLRDPEALVALDVADAGDDKAVRGLLRGEGHKRAQPVARGCLVKRAF